MDNHQSPTVLDGSRACSRQDYDNYIELKFLEASRDAVDGLINHLINIVQNPPDWELVRIFINSGGPEKAQPIRYLMYRLRESRVQLQPNTPTRVAITFNMMPLAQTINLFLRAFRQTTLEFKAFGVGHEQEALDWLCA
jgi:hypothetical protein